MQSTSRINCPIAILCPNCRQPMQAQDLGRHDGGLVRVELCFSCSALWFDHLVSMQLAPAAVIELFKEIYEHRDEVRRPQAAELNCPRCRDALVLSFDLSKAGRFSYLRCPRGDGRFTPFLQFLREKQFIRNLTTVELQRVRSQVHQIRCSECGAPIDLEHDSQCKYCHAPISFLDPDAVEKAVQMWSDAENRRHPGPATQALGNALQRLPLNHSKPSAMPAVQPGDHDGGAGFALDLVALGIHAIGRLFEIDASGP